jgi:DNA-binding transcriptional LysR family regulator
VIEQKSFAKVARQLGLSVPRVSELIRKLEDNLGVRLFEHFIIQADARCAPR